MERDMDALTVFGVMAVTAMLVTYALEHRSPWFTLGFAAACLLGSTYGFLDRAWPFGIIEAVWAVVALRRWWRAKRKYDARQHALRPFRHYRARTQGRGLQYEVVKQTALE